MIKSYSSNLRAIVRKIDETIWDILVLRNVCQHSEIVVSRGVLPRPRRKPVYQRPLLLSVPAQEISGHLARKRSKSHR